MVKGITQTTLSALAVAFTLAISAPADARPHGHNSGTVTPARFTDHDAIQQRLRQIEEQGRPAPTRRGGGGFLDEDRPISLEQERTYRQIASILHQNGERLDLMRRQIFESMSLLNPDESAEATYKAADDWIRNYMLEQSASTQADSTKTPLPERFRQSVRGCTQDGAIYQLTYNIAADFAQLGAFGSNATEEEASLFEHSVQDTDRHFSGIAGTANYLGALNDINETINLTMQRLSGGVIDSLDSEEINNEEYQALINVIVSSTTEGIAERYYGIDIDILVEPARRLRGECSPAFSTSTQGSGVRRDTPPPPPIDEHNFEP